MTPSPATGKITIPANDENPSTASMSEKKSSPSVPRCSIHCHTEAVVAPLKPSAAANPHHR